MADVHDALSRANMCAWLVSLARSLPQSSTRAFPLRLSSLDASPASWLYSARNMRSPRSAQLSC